VRLWIESSSIPFRIAGRDLLPDIGVVLSTIFLGSMVNGPSAVDISDLVENLSDVADTLARPAESIDYTLG